MNSVPPIAVPNVHAQNKFYVKKGLSTPFALIAGILSLLVGIANAVLVIATFSFSGLFNEFVPYFNEIIPEINQVDPASFRSIGVMAIPLAITTICYFLLFIGFFIVFFKSLKHSSPSSVTGGMGCILASSIINVVFNSIAIILNIVITILVLMAYSSIQDTYPSQSNIIIFIVVASFLYTLLSLLWHISLIAFSSGVRKTFNELGKSKGGIGLHSFACLFLSIIDIALITLCILYLPSETFTIPLIILGFFVVYRFSIWFTALSYSSSIKKLLTASPEAPADQLWKAPVPPVPVNNSTVNNPAPSSTENFEPINIPPRTNTSETAGNYARTRYDNRPDEVGATTVLSPQDFPGNITAPSVEVPSASHTDEIGATTVLSPQDFPGNQPNVELSKETSQTPHSPTSSVPSETVQELTVICPSCGAANKSQSAFCGKCGKPIDKHNICPQCATENSLSSKFCKKCGHQLK